MGGRPRLGRRGALSAIWLLEASRYAGRSLIEAPPADRW